MCDDVALQRLCISRICRKSCVSFCAWEADARVMSGFVGEHVFVDSSYLAESSLDRNIDNVREAPDMPSVSVVS